MNEEEMAERIFQLEKQLEEKNKELVIIENRFKHLIESEFIAKYDEVNPKDGKYKYDIESVDNNIDTIIKQNRAIMQFEYCILCALGIPQDAIEKIINIIDKDLREGKI